MFKVVVDTNVFISGILFGGNPRKIIEFWLSKKLIFCLSPELKAEILGKLKIKFSLPLQDIQQLEEALDLYSQKYIPTTKVTVYNDQKDNFLLELVEEANADILISGDKQILKLRKHKNTKIISPKEFIETLK